MTKLSAEELADIRGTTKTATTVVLLDHIAALEAELAEKRIICTTLHDKALSLQNERDSLSMAAEKNLEAYREAQAELAACKAERDEAVKLKNWAYVEIKDSRDAMHQAIGELDRLRAIEAAAKDWLKAHDAHLALYAKGDATFHELDATVAKRTEARERLRTLVGESKT